VEPLAPSGTYQNKNNPRSNLSMNKLRTVFASVGAALVVPAIALAGPPVHAVSHVAAPASTQAQAKPQAMTAKAPVSTKTTGQPNQSCGSATAPNTPGNASTAPGSAFNPNGKAGTVYAGEQPQNSVNPKSVSQYDAACAHQPK
jgi:hypothetical protein